MGPLQQSVPNASSVKNQKMKNELKKVYAVKDNDGHWFVIPAELKELFFRMLDSGHKDEYEEFSSVFDEYMTGGDLNLIQLYAKI